MGTPSAAEKLAAGFDEDEEIVMPMPVDDSSEGEPEEPPEPSSSDALMEQALEAIVDGDTSVAPLLFNADHWRALAADHGLHVCAGRRSAEAASTSADVAADLRRSLEERGYLLSEPLAASEEERDAMRRLKRMLDRLSELGYAPAFIYVFDEAWSVLERCWRLMAAVLAPGEALDSVVLEPSFFAYALARPHEVAAPDTRGVCRHTYVGGNFGLPHRDHSTADCFDARGAPTMVSLWCPLTRVTADNGCMFVVPKEFDPLLPQPDHPLHLLPYDQHAQRANFDVSAAVALAPCDAGCAAAWHGSTIHWGGRCSRFAAAEPRASLTATLRRRDAAHTELQRLQRLPELAADALPLPLHERVRYVAANLLLYKWWYGLARGVAPEGIFV